MVGISFWFVFVVASGLDFLFLVLSISLKVGTDDVLCCYILL